MTTLTKVVVVISVLCFACVLLAFRGCRADGPGGASKMVKANVDLAALRKQILVPDGVTDAKWIFRQVQDHGWVPSPSSAMIVAQLRLLPDATKRLLETGAWVDVVQLPEVLEAIYDTGVLPGRLLRSTADEPGGSVIRGTTWMTVELWIDADNNVLYVAVEKS